MVQETTAMVSYRFYRLNSAGHITGATDEACSNDDEALQKAKRLLQGSGAIEVWEQDRMVHALNPGERRTA